MMLVGARRHVRSVHSQEPATVPQHRAARLLQVRRQRLRVRPRPAGARTCAAAPASAPAPARCPHPHPPL